MAEEILESQRIIEYARWIRKSGKVLATISPENKDGLKQITDILWDSCIDFKNRKFDAVTDDYDYDIHELSTFILICDCLALLRTHPYFHKLRNDLDKCFSVIKKDPVSELEKLYSTSPTIDGYPFLGSLIIDLCKPSNPKLGVLLNDLLNDLFDLVIQIEMNPNHDVLGKIFNELIPAEIRRRMGAFFTKTVYASLIARLSINKPDLKVLDLSCGSEYCYRILWLGNN